MNVLILLIIVSNNWVSLHIVSARNLLFDSLVVWIQPMTQDQLLKFSNLEPKSWSKSVRNFTLSTNQKVLIGRSKFAFHRLIKSIYWVILPIHCSSIVQVWKIIWLKKFQICDNQFSFQYVPNSIKNTNIYELKKITKTKFFFHPKAFLHKQFL